MNNVIFLKVERNKTLSSFLSKPAFKLKHFASYLFVLKDSVSSRRRGGKTDADDLGNRRGRHDVELKDFQVDEKSVKELVNDCLHGFHSASVSYFSRRVQRSDDNEALPRSLTRRSLPSHETLARLLA